MNISDNCVIHTPVSTLEQTKHSLSLDSQQATLYSWLAKATREQENYRIKLGMANNAKNGLCNGTPPFGYNIINKRVVVNQEQALIIKIIFDLYTNKNMGYKDIAIYLNKRNITTFKNNKWQIASIRDKIKNAMYAGFISWNKVQNDSPKLLNHKSISPIFVKGQHEPIIDMETWEKAKIKRENSSSKFIKSL